ncbi:hypothetical protein FQN54_008141 [Arachnomyces sp. PD_36]|nr:hypothetical protein FQN54_008141 [Arachnomyces sp. PD_36]
MSATFKLPHAYDISSYQAVELPTSSRSAMFAIRAVSEWWAWHRESFKSSNSQYPGALEIHGAEFYAFYVVCKVKLYRDIIELHYPHHIDVAQTLDRVLEAFRDDHGGDFPEKVLHTWRDKRERCFTDKQIFPKPGEKEIMLEIWKRWKDLDWLSQKFWALYLSDTDSFVEGSAQDLRISEKHILQLKQCFQDWLQKRKAGEAY